MNPDSSIYSQNSSNISPSTIGVSNNTEDTSHHIIGVSNTEDKGKDKHMRGDLDQSINNFTGGKLDCNHKNLKIVNHYLDPDNPDFSRDYWNLIKLGVDDNMTIWSYKSDMSTI